MPWKHRVSLEKTPFLSRGLPTMTRGQSKTVLFKYLQGSMDKDLKWESKACAISSSFPVNMQPNTF